MLPLPLTTLRNEPLCEARVARDSLPSGVDITCAPWLLATETYWLTASDLDAAATTFHAKFPLRRCTVFFLTAILCDSRIEFLER